MKHYLAKTGLTCGVLFLLLGSVFAKTFYHPDPIDWIDRINDIRFAGQKSMNDKILDLHELMKIYLNQGNPKDSIYARMAHRLGDFYRINMDTDRAIDFFEEAVKINSSKSQYAEHKYLCETYCNLGLTYLEIDLEKAEEYFEKSLEIFRKFPEEKGFVAVIIQENRASYYFGKGDYQKAIDIIDYALASIPGIENSNKGNILLLQKAYSLQELGNIKQSKEIFEQVIKDFEAEEKDLDAKATAFSMYAQFLEKTGNPAQAIEFFEKSLAIRKSLGFNFAASSTLYMMGQIYLKDDPIKAKKYFEESMQLIKGLDAGEFVPILYNGIGLASMNSGNNMEALRNFQEGLIQMGIGFENKDIFINPSLEDFKYLSNDQIGVTILKNKGECLLKAFKEQAEETRFLSAAVQSYLLADKLVDQMRWNQANTGSKEFWRSKTKSLYEKALEASYLSNEPEYAFYFMEKSRAVLLNDRLNELGAKNLLSQNEVGKESDLRKSIDQIEQEMKSLPPDDARKNALVKDWYHARESYEKFIISLEAKYPAYYQYKYDTQSFSIHEFKGKVLADNQTYVSYFFGEQNLFVLKIGKEETKLEMMPVGGTLDKIKQLNNLINDRSKLNSQYPEFLALSNSLYNDLVKPLDLSEPRVVFSLEEKIMPFEVFISDPLDPESFLLKNHSISYTYSVQFLNKAFQDPVLNAKSFLGLAPVDFSKVGMTSLIGSDASLKKAGSLFPKPKILAKEKASKKNFLNEFHHHPLVHIYSHAEVDSLGNEPTIHFFDEPLKLADIPFEFLPKTGLIVLSACNTGVGRSVIGEGVMSLARGFAAIGVPSSITTLWDVDDQATYFVSELFYKYLSEGYFTDEALQKAKLDYFLNQDKGNRIPYYWGGMVLLGKASSFSIDHNHSKSNFGLIFSILAFLALAGYYVNRRMQTEKKSGLQ